MINLSSLSLPLIIGKICAECLFYVQAGALVHVYTDGTVLVTHGGVEMGQGLHTKVAQVAASAFNIPLRSVFISDTSTDKVILQTGALLASIFSSRHMTMGTGHCSGNISPMYSCLS